MRLGSQTLKMLEDIPRKVIHRGDIIVVDVAAIYMKPMICSLHLSFLPMKPIAAELLL